MVARPALCHTEGTADGIGLPPPIRLGGPRGTELPGPILEGVSGRAEVPALHAAVGPVGRGAHCGLCELIVARGGGLALTVTSIFFQCKFLDDHSRIKPVEFVLA